MTQRMGTVFRSVVVAGLLVVFAGIAAAQQPVTIRWASYNIGTTFLERMEQAVAEFERIHPNIKVEIEYRPPQEYWDKLQVEYAAGIAPDVTINQIDWLPVGARAGMFVDLTPYVERDAIDLSDYFPVALSDWTFENRLYAGILYLAGEVFMVNTHHLAQAGLGFPDESWTWETMVDAARKMTVDQNGDGQFDRFGLELNVGIYNGVASFIREAGGEVLNATRDASRLNETVAKDAIRFIYELHQEHKVIPLAEDRNRGMTFQTGNVGMARTGIWIAAAMRGNVDFEFDFAVPPAGPTGNRNLQWGSNAWSVMASSNHKEEAWQLVKFLMTEPGQVIFADTALPGIISLARSRELTDLWPGLNFETVVHGVANYGHDYYPTSDWGEWVNAAGQALGPVWTGQRPPEQGAELAHEAIMNVFARRELQ